MKRKNLLEILGLVTGTELLFYVATQKHTYEPVYNFIKLGFIDPISRITGYN